MKLQAYEDLALKIEDLQTLLELATEENDESLQNEIADGLDTVAHHLEQMELRLMLTGEFDAEQRNPEHSLWCWWDRRTRLGGDVDAYVSSLV